MKPISQSVVLAIAFLGSVVAVASVRWVIRAYCSHRPSDAVPEPITSRAEPVAEVASAADSVVLSSVEQIRSAAIQPIEPKALAGKEEEAGHAGGQVDDEWDSYPRTRGSWADLLINHYGDVRPQILFRHRQLNPDDRYIAPAQRASLAGIIEAGKAGLMSLDAQRSAAASQEFASLLKAGQARPRSMQSLHDQMSEEEKTESKAVEDRMLAAMAKASGRTVEDLRSDPTTGVVYDGLFPKSEPRPVAYAVRGGVVYYAHLADLPSARRIADASSFVSGEYLAAVSGFFVSAGTLNTEDAASFVTEFMREQLQKR